ncbi:helix-turn-helix transcriptional regulator [Chitinophaga sp. 22321]|uniref:Helix-turn-helix transcriptional regulator n=1 Tax=Chitinophaga hostae TaxID=2831022 RepID=A0ABS5J7K5_9BACT|nr:AraC family transcriptional regulator [Chitinophaga hostae]MBS0031184.1 helix-turn-helix transcriptional regulator [Chitinophaga hostae]
MVERTLPPAPASYDQMFSPGRAVVQDLALPFEDKQGIITLAMLNRMGVADSRFQTDRIAPPWQHLNSMPFVEMNFIVEGDLYQTIEGFPGKRLCARGANNIMFNPGSLEKNELIGYGKFRTFGVHVNPDRMAELLTAYVPELEKYAEKIYAGKPFILESPAPVITAGMKYIFDTIWQCPNPEGLKKLYIESKILDLLSLQCEGLLQPVVKKTTSIPRPDIDKLYAARTLLEQQLDQPPALAELSKLCQLNEFKLKKGFRELFNTTVYGFVHEMRLTRAQQMIREGQYNISEIAYKLGYSHPQHFQRAFKKQFGVTPGTMLR